MHEGNRGVVYNVLWPHSMPGGTHSKYTEADICIRPSRISRTLSAKDRKAFQREGTMQRSGHRSVHKIKRSSVWPENEGGGRT